VNDTTRPNNKLVTKLSDARSGYEVPDDDLVNEVLVPALQNADRIDIAVGFFSSHCISQIAPGLASLIDRKVSCRLLVSPEISAEDRDAIDRGLREPKIVIDRFMVDLFQEPPDALSAHTADCLAFLIANDTLQLRCVLMDRGMFHKKLWIFEESGVRMAVHGSGNMTARGLLVNGEQMTIDRPWMDGTSATNRVRDFADSFELEWTNQKPGRLTIEPTQMIALLDGRKDRHREPPTTTDFWDAWNQDNEAGLAPDLPPGFAHPPAAKRLTIPPWLDWTHPPYEHQERAVAALKERRYIALIAMATGGGKTKTALISTCQIQDEISASLLVVILVPTKVLAIQWADEVRDFGVNPTVLSGMTPAARSKVLEDTTVSLRTDTGRTEVLISTLALFTGDEPLRQFVNDASEIGRTVLIADEVHNFGAPSFIGDPPKAFQYRIGLSATPIRQYDAEGSAELFTFFDTTGEPAFTFTLREAIHSGCLVPYNYRLHPVALTDEEMERYQELTHQLRRSGFGRDNGADFGLTEQQERLLRERRALTEQASGKVNSLGSLLAPVAANLSHALIYCSAKAVLPPHEKRQIDLVRILLEELRITTHMYTAVESGRAGSQAYLDGFAAEEYQTLLAMKVLDEGVDVPAAHHAFLLASSTVEREWVQRRGRVLRTSPGKTSAEVHDFIVVPPDPSDPDGKTLLRSELRRAEHFTSDALNKYDTGGPRDVIASLEETL
jgi:superfamily II DNA or RNA helicase/HKD family nuclease